MTSREIINEMKQLSNAERLAIVEEATRLIRQEIAGSPEDVTKERLSSQGSNGFPARIDSSLRVLTATSRRTFTWSRKTRRASSGLRLSYWRGIVDSALEN